jgi:hypothetical protein
MKREACSVRVKRVELVQAPMEFFRRSLMMKSVAEKA